MILVNESIKNALLKSGSMDSMGLLVKKSRCMNDKIKYGAKCHNSL
jgi:hypothetical protein